MLRRLFVLLVVLLTLAAITVPSCVIAEITNDNKKNLETILDNSLLGKNRFRVEDKSTATRYSQNHQTSMAIHTRHATAAAT